uniref:Uncharacterized protein n=1 Tax=Catagonus wagneri TaxID=51154 RepID=A0A8C3X6I2_9CETA
MFLADIFRPLAVNQHRIVGLGGHAGLLHLGLGSPGNGLSLVVPSWVILEKLRIEMLHGTTTLAFKFLCGVVAADSQAPAGSGLHYMDSEGDWILGAAFSVGSGSVYAYEVTDQSYSYDLEVGQAYGLTCQTIYCSTYREAYSGGSVNIYHVWEGGWIQISRYNVADLHDNLVTLPPEGGWIWLLAFPGVPVGNIGMACHPLVEGSPIVSIIYFKLWYNDFHVLLVVNELLQR